MWSVYIGDFFSMRFEEGIDAKDFAFSEYAILGNFPKSIVKIVEE